MPKKPAQLTNEGGIHPSHREIRLKYANNESMAWTGSLINNYVLFETWPFEKDKWTLVVRIVVDTLQVKTLYALRVPAGNPSQEMFIRENAGKNIYGILPAFLIEGLSADFDAMQTGPEVIGE